MKKIVDVLLDDELLISYEIILEHLNMPLAEDDFIKVAKENLKEDQYSSEAQRDAKFVVRDSS